MKKLNDPIDPDAYPPEEAQRESEHLRTLYPEWKHLARLQPQGEMDCKGNLGAVRKVGGLLYKAADCSELTMAEAALQVIYDQGANGWENIRVIFRGNLTSPALIVRAPDLATAFYFIEHIPERDMGEMLNEFVQEVIVRPPAGDDVEVAIDFEYAPQPGKVPFDFSLSDDFQKEAAKHFLAKGKTPKAPVVLRDLSTLN